MTIEDLEVSKHLPAFNFSTSHHMYVLCKKGKLNGNFWISLNIVGYKDVFWTSQKGNKEF